MAWLKKRGVKFQDYIYQIYGGIYPRCRNPIGPRGQAYIQVLVPEAKRVGVDLRTNAKVLGIHREHALEGRVTGVEVEIGGKKLHIRATKGVIACAGGFSANAKMCGIHDPRLEKLGTTNQPGATGEVLVNMVDIGAETRGMDYIQCIPEKPLDVKHNPALSTQVNRFVFVNHEGKRFVAEDARRDVLRDAVLAQTKMEVFPAIDDVGFELQKNLNGPENEAARCGGDALHREHDRRARGSALRDLENACAATRALRRFSVRRSVGRTRTFLASSTCRGISSRECTRDSRL